jgi:hypothetical protein
MYIALGKPGAFVMNTKTRNTILDIVKTVQKKDRAGRWYVDLTCKGVVTECLKNILNLTGCFDFYSTNSGEYIIGVSQIVAYFYIGYKWLLKGVRVTKTSHNVHHISGDISDNRPQNLVILTVEDHLIVSKITNETLDANQYESELIEESVRYNNQGHKVKDPVHFLKIVIAKTLHATERWLAKAIQGKGVQWAVKRVVDWVSKTVSSLLGFQELTGLRDRFYPEDFDFAEYDRKNAELAKAFGLEPPVRLKMSDLLEELYRPDGCEPGEAYL